MLLRQEGVDGVDVLAVRGQVAEADALALVEAVEAVVDRPTRGVVLDLREVSAVEPGAAETLRVLSRRVVPGWPHAALCLCGAPPEVVHVLPELPSHATRAQALAAVEQRPSAERYVVTIEHSVRGPRQARAVVAACVARLDLDEAADDLALVVSEMVTNAVRHGQPPLQLEVLTDDEKVLVAVADGSPRPPLPRFADDDAEGGRGMALVDLLCSEHGVRPDPPGKTVWACVRRPSTVGGPRDGAGRVAVHSTG